MNWTTTLPTSPPNVAGLSTGVLASITALPSAMVVMVLVILVSAMCYVGKKCGEDKKTIEITTNPLPPASHVIRKKNPIYEELPCTIFDADHPQLLRQCAVVCDPVLSKVENNSGSDEPVCSELSGLSGVSGNIPGAHHMPKYGTEGSVILDRLQPPQPWNKKSASHSTFSTTQTISTGLQSNGYSDMHHTRSHSNSEHCNSGPFDNPVGRQRSSSQGHINQHLPYVEKVYATEVGNLYSHYSQKDLPPFNNSVVRSYFSNGSNPSIKSSAENTLSRGNFVGSNTQQSISNDMILSVLNHLQHNKNCEIPNCVCQQVASASRKHNTVHEHKVRKLNTMVSCSSTESDSDTPENNNGKKAKMRLELGKGKNSDPQLYPHYHLSAKSHIRNSQCESCKEHRRSRSVSDLTPITEMGETATPLVGGPIVPGTPICPPNSLGFAGNVGGAYKAPTKQELLTLNELYTLAKPRPPLLREQSISVDNIPVLCLNDCLAKLMTPSPSKSRSLCLTNVRNKNDSKEGSIPIKAPETSINSETNHCCTLPHSNSKPEAANWSHSSFHYEDEDVNQAPLTTSKNSMKVSASLRRPECSGYESWEGDNSSISSVFTAENTLRRCSSDLKPCKSRFSPIPTTSLSSSPFETETTVSRDGSTTILTTAC